MSHASEKGGRMRDKIAEVVEKSWEEAMDEWALDTSVDPPEYGHVAADAVVGLLRQGPTVTVTRDRYGYQYASLPGVAVDDLIAERSYALVLLPEEE